MGLLDRLERALETLIEGRAAGARIHPLEIARRMAAEMQAQKRLSVRSTFVPNTYRALLAPADRGALGPVAEAVQEELREFLQEQVDARDYALTGPLAVDIGEDAALSAGEMRIEATFAVEPTPEARPVPARKTRPVTPPAVDAIPQGARAVLRGVSGFAKGVTVWLQVDTARLGRSPECEVHLPDPQVSKVHAVLVWTGDGYRLDDADSRNGVRLNGAPVVGSAALRSGDRIEAGASIFAYHVCA
ncbi:MAG: DUF2662 domain-containing protein [Armatimonadetes bacterium]|nr:DUF2662 domain-containing protein [Armatimonadota bacterium]